MPSIVKEFVKALAANSTDAAYDAYIPTSTEPEGSDVHEVLAEDDTLEVTPYGVGADNDTFSLIVVGWRKFEDLWIPKDICEVNCTLGNKGGEAGSAIDDTHKFCDLITDVEGTVVAPTVPQNGIAGFLVSIASFEKYQLVPKKGSATSVNALFNTFGSLK